MVGVADGSIGLSVGVVHPVCFLLPCIWTVFHSGKPALK
jgi:hypothetical protein